MFSILKQELIDYIDKHPEQFRQTMRKRKKEELENAGLSSFINVLLKLNLLKCLAVYVKYFEKSMIQPYATVSYRHA